MAVDSAGLCSDRAAASNLLRLIDRMRAVRVLVIGEAMLDSYSFGAVTRVCPEAPVPVVDVCERVDEPGGAANCAANVAALGGRARLASIIGEDADAGLLLSRLAELGVDSGSVIRDPERRTLAKHRLSAGGQQLVRFDHGSTGAVAAESEGALTAAIERAWPDTEAVVISDYAYGVVSATVIRAISELQGRAPRVLVVDARDPLRYGDVPNRVPKPNVREAARVIGESDESALRAGDAGAAQRLLSLCRTEIAVVTCDADGALLIKRGEAPLRRPADFSGRAFPSGAGDTFGAAFAMALAAAGTPEDALEVASVAAGVVVAGEGTKQCPWHAVAQRFTMASVVGAPPRATAAAVG